MSIVLNSSQVASDHGLVFLLIGLMWGWSLIKGGSNSHLSPLLKSHNVASSWGYLGSLVMLLGSWTLRSRALTNPTIQTLFPVWGSLFVLSAFGIYGVYLRLDHHKRGIWHHRRVRPALFGIAACVILLSLALKVSYHTISLLLAVAIFNRQQRHIRQLLGELFLSQENLRKKILSLEADLTQSKTARGVDLARIPQSDSPGASYKMSS